MSVIAVFCLFLGVLFNGLPAKAIDAQFRYCVFQQPDKGPYIETYLSVNSRSIAFVVVGPNQLQGAIELTIDFSRNDTIVLFDKYTLKSPIIDTNGRADFAFLDLQRFGLAAGTYTMHLRITDKNDSSNTANAVEKIVFGEAPLKPTISDVMLVSKISQATANSTLSKNGLELLPRASTFFGEGEDTLQFYFEVYGSQQLIADSIFIVKTWLETTEGVGVANASRFYKRAPRNVVAIADAILLDEVPSGNYNLKIEVRSRLNDLLAQQVIQLQRMNSNIAFDEQKLLATLLGGTFVDKFNREQLKECIKSTRPIAQRNEREYADNLLKQKEVDEEFFKRYLLSFWEARNKVNPAGPFEAYQEEVNKANQLFSSKINKGYETERGRVYLQYGSPNSRTVIDNEPSAYPYEIWWYYEYKGQRNIRFVFYNPDMVTNDYQLLHSEALGETFDPQWRLILFSRTTSFQNLDDTRNRDHFGTRLEDNFRNQ